MLNSLRLPTFIAILISAHVAAAGPTYPESYQSSRAQFRAECTKALATCKTFTLDSRVDPDLTVDSAFFSGGGSRLLILQSGLHGIEAPAGAAVQHLAAERFVNRLVERGIDVLMIHAINPYGFKYGRRTDEFNVNLNRNFPTDVNPYVSKNEPYENLRGTFEPGQTIERYGQNYRRVRFGLVAAFLRAKLNSIDKPAKKQISEAMNSGQYVSAEGVNYGGAGPAQQVGLLRNLLTPLVPKYEKVLLLDLHTGLGEDGTLHVMPARASAATGAGELKNLVASLGEGFKITDVNSDEDFFSTTGDVVDFVASLSTPGTAVVAATAEFGTMGTDFLSQLDSGVRIISENQAHFKGGERRAVAKVKRDFAELFNPSSNEWRTKVTDRATRLLEALVQSF